MWSKMIRCRLLLHNNIGSIKVNFPLIASARIGFGKENAHYNTTPK